MNFHTVHVTILVICAMGMLQAAVSPVTPKLQSCIQDQNAQRSAIPVKRILYTVENLHTADEKTHFQNEMIISQNFTYFYPFMTHAASQNSAFQFTAQCYEQYGAFINSVNGLAGGNNTFWAFMRRSLVGECLHNVGVSLYKPFDGDWVVLSYKPYSVFSQIPNCKDD